MYYFALILLNILLLLLYLHKRKFSIFSSVNIFLLFFYVILIVSVLYHYFIPDKLKINLYNFDLYNAKKFIPTIFVFVQLLNFFLIGHVLYKFKNTEYQRVIKNKIDLVIATNFKANLMLYMNLALIFVSLCLLFFDYGTELFYRKDYIPYESSVFKLIYTLLFLVISFISGFYYKHNKLIHSLIFILVILSCIAIGSRNASINLIVFLFAFYTQMKTNKRWFLLFSFVLVLVFFGYNLSLRSELTNHGLIPYLLVTFEKPEIIFNYIYKNIYYNLVYGTYATADTIKNYTFNYTENLLIAINPMPGRYTSWYEIANRMRSNEYAPFTGVGELFKTPMFFKFYWLVIGYYFSSLDFKIKKAFINKNYFLSLVLLLFVALFCIFIFEYNLRSSNRFIYYSFILSLFYNINYRNGKIYIKR